ncbi:hypothetical protein COCCADRAFT_40990 [Bipolaris zeicola 26-R-13]|uniref:Uncharacterized protein n=1 Tax=Cochliobolus carbonum (strain 26-R-13) TaxID=930089 RepID=W6XMI9_COCC2|nr:uncharacterized protein COCCADRAFT_40990 [Bipolaris zeicola 26-R-13]EUC28492.1 hypothetical protein COCCADRAFT_40990 [Bipolaris zeicola 26-R-13]
MGSRIEGLLENLRKVPDGEIISEAEFKHPLSFLQPWGFTIYRTYYEPGSDQRWDELIQSITNGAKDAIRGNVKPTDDPAMIAKTEELFKPDARSDPAVLDGLALEEVRQLYHNGTGGQPMNTDRDPWRIFILADREVLTNPNLGMIKCVAADYDAAACVPKNPRFGPQRYFGWLRMSPNHVLKLWFELDIYFIKQIVNFAAGGPGAWWDPDAEC